MPTYITAKPRKDGSIVITMVFKDEDEQLKAPDSLSWIFMKTDETIVRSDTVSSPTDTEEVLLKGTDLAMDDTNPVRIFEASWTFTSDLGAGIPDKASCVVVIERPREIGVL